MKFFQFSLLFSFVMAMVMAVDLTRNIKSGGGGAIRVGGSRTGSSRGSSGTSVGSGSSRSSSAGSTSDTQILSNSGSRGSSSDIQTQTNTGSRGSTSDVHTQANAGTQGGSFGTAGQHLDSTNNQFGGANLPKNNDGLGLGQTGGLLGQQNGGLASVGALGFMGHSNMNRNRNDQKKSNSTSASSSTTTTTSTTEKP